MDNQDQMPVAHVDPTNPEPVASPTQVTAPTNPVTKPKLDIPDDAARSLLTINSAQSSQTAKHRLPIGIIITILVLIALVVISSFAVGKAKPVVNNGATTSPNSGASDSSGSSDSNSVNNQINQDVKSCTNPVNAVSEC